MRFRSSWRRIGLVCAGTTLAALAGLAPRHEARAGALEPNQRAVLRGGHVTAESSAGELRFEANAGQFQDDVRFLARGKRYGVYLTPDGATLALQPSSSVERSVLSLKVVGARAVEPSGETQLGVRSNYFVGERDQWRTDVPNFARVRYADVLPGVDVVYHGADGRELEYDLVLKPGVDPDLLQIEVSGQLALSLAENGDALLQISDGQLLRKRAPIAYQLTASGARELVPARFRLLGRARLGFVVGEHDASRTLVIDPVLSYSSYLGGSRFDEFYAVAADSSGNTYAAGYTTGTLFPTHAPAQGAYGGGSSDAVVVKLNPAGSSLVYSTYLGGTDADQARGLAVDATGNAYVTGVTYSTNFPTTAALQPAHAGGQQDAFVTKLSASGALVFSTFLGGSGIDFASAIAVRSGEAYVTGNTNSTNYPGVSAYQPANGGGFDAFVSHLSGSGTLLLYSSYLGGSLDEFGESIAVDTSGRAFVVGSTTSSNFPTFPPQATIQASYGGGSDAFVSCLSSSGTALAYSTYLGGSARDEALSVSVTPQGGGVVVVGATSSANFPIAGAQASQPTKAGAQDAFVSLLDASGSSLSYSTYLGGAASDTAHGVALDNTGIAYVIGETSSANFPVASGFPGQEAYAGSGDAFLTAINSSGGRLFSSYLGGSGKDVGMSVSIGQAGTLHLLGNTFSSNFPTASPLFSAPVGVPDAFVAKVPLLANMPAPWGPAPLLVSLALLLLGCGSLLARTSTRRSA